MLIDHEVACSRSDVGNGYDNPVAERFVASMKEKCVHLTAFAPRTDAYDAIEHYLNGFYNPLREHFGLRW